MNCWRGSNQQFPSHNRARRQSRGSAGLTLTLLNRISPQMLAHVRQLRPQARRDARRRRGPRGFTLIETALATIIVGVGIVASMQLFATCSVQNRVSNQMTAAM